MGSLVFGVLSVTLLSIIAGIPAIILGHMSLANIKKSMGRVGGKSLAIAGLVMGYLSVTIFFPIILIIAAIAIPNLMRARMAANESAAAATVRTLSTVQLTYSYTYPLKGYSPDLATLGPGRSATCERGGSESQACLIDDKLGNSRCTAAVWCIKNAFRYSISGICKKGKCDDYVITATPVDSNQGRKNFCATSDEIVRLRPGPPVRLPLTISECQSWEPL